MWSLRVFDELVRPLNLWRAWQEFSRDKRRRPAVAALALDADRVVFQLARTLADGTYRPSGYQLLFIHDPKRRVIAAAPVVDRVVHHAVHRLCAPRFDRALIEHTYACLPGRGSHRAVLRFLGGMRRFRFVLKLDIARYFYSIDRQVLKQLLDRHLPEPRLQVLLGHILSSGAGLYQRRDVTEWLGWDAPMPKGRGLPIGNLTSQWWGNLYLGAADHLVCRTLRVPMYQRYMDDMTLFGDDRGALLAARDHLAAWLSTERGLTLKDPHALPLRTDRRGEYLGYRVTRRGVTLGDKARRRLRQNLVEHTEDSDRLRAAVAAYAAAWHFGE